MKIKQIIAVFSAGLIAGFIIGLGKFIADIIANKYIEYEMYGIIFRNLPQVLNKWVLLLVSYMVVVAVLLLLWPLISRIAEIIWKLLFSNSLRIDVTNDKRFKKAVVLIFCFITFTYFGWAVNYYWLPGRFSTNSLIFDAGFLLFTIFQAWILIRRNWRDFLKRVVERNYALKLALIPAMLLIILNFYSLVSSGTDTTDKPNVIFICIDTLRADHLGMYGYERDTSPSMDQLAKSGVVFTNVTSQSSWTKTSVATFMTSTYDMLNRVKTEEDKLPLGVNTLAEILKNNGYATGAIIANPWLLPQFAFNQGFDYYNSSYVADETRRRIKVENITKYIDKNKNKKFFLYLHFMDVHNPYHPPAPFNTMFSGVEGRFQYRNGPMKMNKEDFDKTMGLYDGEIRFLDEKINSIIMYLKEQKLFDNTLIVINSDHGEEFMEHGGAGHGTTLYQELLHVPLIIVHKGNSDIKGSVINSKVRNIDILPTILDILNISPVTEIDGISLLPLIKGDKGVPSPSIASVTALHTRDKLVAISGNKFKYIYNRSKKLSELFDLEKDADEKDNLINVMPELAMKMHNELQNITSEFTGVEAPSFKKSSINNETLKTLKSLGYIQ